MTSNWLKELWIQHGKRIMSEGWGRYKIMGFLNLGENQARSLLDFVKAHGSPPGVTSPVSKRGVVLSDIHFPYQNDTLLRKVLRFIPDFKPDIIVLNGDLLDCYALSFFDKDPSRILSLQEEIDICKGFLYRLRVISGKDCRIMFLEGNHEERKARQLAKNPQFKSLSCLTWESLLELEKYDIEYFSYRHIVEIEGVCFTHGHYVRRCSGVTVRSHFQETHKSIVVGHCHRSAHTVYRDYSGVFEAVENGCLCDLEQSYLRGKIADWVNGFSVVLWFDGHHRIQNIIAKDNKFYFEGRVY